MFVLVVPVKTGMIPLAYLTNTLNGSGQRHLKEVAEALEFYASKDEDLIKMMKEVGCLLFVCFRTCVMMCLVSC